MLVLARKCGQSLVIDGKILVKVIRVEGSQIYLGIEAPREVSVHREEIQDAINHQQQPKEAREWNFKNKVG